MVTKVPDEPAGDKDQSVEPPSLEESNGLIGPFRRNEYVLVHDEFVLPNLRVRWAPAADGVWWVYLNRDGDESLVFPFDDLKTLRWVIPLLAYYGAVSAGYTSFGENAAPRNPFKCRIGLLGAASDPSNAGEPS
jgi:hypothetical protein